MRLAKTVFFATVCSAAALASASTIFVDSTASGANNGSSWPNAYTSLQSALAAAAAADEIWVRAGTYKPTATTDRTASFALKNGVGVYGGFAGTETMRSQRNPAANVTILSGDIGTPSVATDNSYHVVTSDGTVTATGVLDGFTVTGGRADGASDPTDRGGGAYTALGSPTFARCIFTGNHAGNRGGGVRVVSGSPSFTDCVFQGNFGQTAGGGLSAGSVSSIQVRGAVFRSNSVGNSTGGGGIEATDNTALINCVIAQNSPNGIVFFGGGNTLTNSTVTGNSGYGIVLVSVGSIAVSNSILWGDSTGEIFLGPSSSIAVSYSDVQGGGFAGTGNIDANPLFVNSAAGNFKLATGSPAVDSGNNAAVPGGVTTDIAGLPRFFDDPGVANAGAGTPPIVDMGAHERIPLSVSGPSPKSQTVCAGESATFSVTASGSPPFSYRWRKGSTDLVDGGAISGSATATLTINPTASGDSGVYTAIVTDGFGQTLGSGTASLTVNPQPIVASNNGPICEGQTLNLSASTVVGASYSWTGPNGFSSSAQNPSIVSATVAASGTYGVTVTVAGCTSSSSTTNAVVNSAPSPAITAPVSVCPSSAGHTASVPDAGVGATYSWDIGNGTITAGQGTRSITFSVDAAGEPVILQATVQNASGCYGQSSTEIPIDAACPAVFHTVAPCRVADTRDPDGSWGGPALAAQVERAFTIVGRCAIPSSAKSVSFNVTVTQPTHHGHLTLYPGGGTPPLASTINYSPGQTRANNAILPLGAGGTVAVLCGQAAGTTHVILDVTGYFE